MLQFWQITFVFVFPLSAAGLALLNAISAWQKREFPGGKSLAALMMAVAIWSSIETLLHTTQNLSTKILLSQIQYVGISSTPVLFLMFAARFSQQDHWLTKRNTILIWTIPSLTFLMAATNNLHFWHWQGFALNPVTNLLTYHYGPWFWVFTATAYGYLIGATILLVRSSLQLQDQYRSQVKLVLLAAVVPWVSNIIHISGFMPIPGLDPTPLAMAISGFILTLSIAEFHLIDIGPIARSKLVDVFQDALIVVDKHDLIVDINPAALSIIQMSLKNVIRQPARIVLSHWPHLATRFSSQKGEKTELVLIPDRNQRIYDTRISPLLNKTSQFSGYLIILRDVTEQKKVEAERAQLATVIEQAQETFVITDLEGNITYANPHFQETTGYNIEEALGSNSRILKSGKHAHDFYGELWNTIKDGEIWTGTFINKRKDGSEYHEAATIFPIKDNHGMITNFASVKRDISAQVQAEAAIQYFTKQLTALHEISILLSLQETYDDICQQAIELGHERLGFDRIGLCFIDRKDPDYMTGTFGIGEDGQIRDERKRRNLIAANPDHLQLINRKERLIYIQDAELRNEKSEVVGRGELAVAGIWDKGKIFWDDFSR